MSNQPYSVNSTFVANLSSVKEMIGEIEPLLKLAESQNFKISDIINKLLNNSEDIIKKIQTKKLMDIDLSSLNSSEKYILSLIPASPLGHYSRNLVAEIKKLISGNSIRSRNLSREGTNELVLLISIMLLAQTVQK